MQFFEIPKRFFKATTFVLSFFTRNVWQSFFIVEENPKVKEICITKIVEAVLKVNLVVFPTAKWAHIIDLPLT